MKLDHHGSNLALLERFVLQSIMQEDQLEKELLLESMLEWLWRVQLPLMEMLGRFVELERTLLEHQWRQPTLMRLKSQEAQVAAGAFSTGGAIAEAVDAGAFYEIGQHNNDGEANPRANAIYSETELQLLSSIAEKAANLFTTGKLGRLFNIETAATIIAGGGITAQ